jgi:serine/threonine protein kinase
MRRISATELMPSFAGRFLDHGRYRLFNHVGSGAYGKVYRAIDVSHRSSKKQSLAIKCLNKQSRTESSAYALQLRRELENHKLVSGHPNIVKFHRCFSDGLYVYVVLDFCDGGDLFSAITKKQLFHRNDRLTKSAFVQLIDAVAHCHKLGVFHRDIKPENILCSDDGSEIRLSDFGLSIMSPYSRDFGCGSSYYMSPGKSLSSTFGDLAYQLNHNRVYWSTALLSRIRNES